MSIRITVKSADLTQRDAKGRTLYEQTAWAFTCDRNGKLNDYPERIRLTFWTDKAGNMEGKAYAPGDYTLAPNSFYVGDYGSLQCSPRLVPVAQAPARS